MRYSWILISLVGFSVAGPIDLDVAKLEEALMMNDVASKNPIIEAIIINLIEDLRQSMLNGSDDFPVLDPFQLDAISVDEQDLPLPGLRLSVNDLTVTQLSTFVVDDLSMNLIWPIPIRYRMNIEAHIPKIVVDIGKYDLYVPIFGGHIFGNGDGGIEVIEPRITGSLVVEVSIINQITLRESDLKFSLGGFEPKITGMMEDESVSNFINAFLRNLVPELIEFFEDDISQVINAIVLEVAGDILGS